MPDQDYGGGNYNSGLGNASGNWGSSTDAGASANSDTSAIGGLGGGGDFGGSLGGVADDGGYGTSAGDSPNNGFDGFGGGGYAGDSTSEGYGDPGVSGGIASLGSPATSAGIDSWGDFGLRGPTGPVGEPRGQPTGYGTNYQTAQMMRGLYSNIGSRYTDPGLAQTLNTFASAMPGEADWNKYGPGSMQGIGRVGLNQMIRNISGEKMLAGMDTTGMRPGTQHLSVPGPSSIGMQAPESPLHTLASGALQNSLFGQGVPDQASIANNFVAAGTPAVPGTVPIGQPVNGTQYAMDPSGSAAIAARTSIAQDVLKGLMGEPGIGQYSIQPMSNELDPLDQRDPNAPSRTFDNGAPMPQQNPYSDVSKFNFSQSGASRAELQDVDARVLGMTADLQGQYGKPIGITEGNAASGHVDGSQHYENQALDLSVPTGDRADLIGMASATGFGGIGAYNNSQNMVHVDGRAQNMAWGPSGSDDSFGQISDPRVAQALAAHDAQGGWNQLAKAGSAVKSYGKQLVDRGIADIQANKGKVMAMTLANMMGSGTPIGANEDANGSIGEGPGRNQSFMNQAAGTSEAPPQDDEGNKQKLQAWLRAMSRPQSGGTTGWGWRTAGKDFWDYGNIDLFGQR